MNSRSGGLVGFLAWYAAVTIVSGATVVAQTTPATKPHNRVASQSPATQHTGASSGASASNNTVPLPVFGSGSTNFIPLWTGRQVIGNSILSQVPGGLNVAGAVTGTSFSGDGSKLMNVNALTLQGLPSSSFAQIGVTNTFTADQTINGNLNLSGFINSSLSLQGNLTDPQGEQGANVIGGFQGAPGVPGNSVSPGVIGATIAGGGGIILAPSVPPHARRTRTSRVQPTAPNTVPGANIVMANWGTIGGGAQNCSNGGYATVAGGVQNCATGYASAVGGGAGNIASGGFGESTVAGGLANNASADWSSVGGGQENVASGANATVAGGAVNNATGDSAVVGGGSGNSATGFDSTIPGGFSNTAAGQYTFAAGFASTANYDGSFVWSDSSPVNGGAQLTDTAPNQFVARGSGGFLFYTASDLSTGATLPSGSGSWTSLSDRNVKDHFADIDGQSLLTKLAALPILTWNYKTQPTSIRHIGPMAQDFRAAFGLGEDDKHISAVDAQGVAFAAIQALYNLTEERNAKILDLTQALNQRVQQLKEVEQRVSRLEELIDAIRSASVTRTQRHRQPVQTRLTAASQ